ncbi:uncharacterized protein LOC119373745 isoform X2 [Rhipicephalus sanguineus]|uniref:uncharacterized protein LOC119373745 isoform X2 n=1 Tax=Rhipicephalus sanguineus TaxID=34632 RepID=UPI00189485F1|nr:uncharacterized protein LOC119373745 isoform X2 [Rhipicephalus sanguineus]
MDICYYRNGQLLVSSRRQSSDTGKRSYLHSLLPQQSRNEVLRHTRLVGVFDKKNIMYVHPYGSTYKVKHEITFFDKQAKCAVFRVLSMSSFVGHVNKVDLRVWNTSDVAVSARPCLLSFKKQTRGGHIIYKNMCQKMFEKSRASQDLDIEGRKSPHDTVCHNEA